MQPGDRLQLHSFIVQSHSTFATILSVRPDHVIVNRGNSRFRVPLNTIFLTSKGSWAAYHSLETIEASSDHFYSPETVRGLLQSLVS